MGDKLKDLHAAVSSCAKAEHHSNLDTRLDQIESSIVAGSGKADKASKDADAANAKIRELQSKVMGDYSMRDQNSGALEDRLGEIDSGLTDVNESASKNARAIDAIQAKLRDALNKLDQYRSFHEGYKATSDQRLSYIESLMTETAGAKVGECTREIEQRLMYMQEEQKRARDVLESSLQEQIRLEHAARDSQAIQIKEQWDREMKARQAYQDSYKELLSHERMAREAHETNLDRRCHACEQCITQETQRIWTALERHEIVVEKTVIPAPRPAPIEVRMPSTQVLPTVQQRVVAPSQSVQVVRTRSERAVPLGTSTVVPAYTPSTQTT